MKKTILKKWKTKRGFSLAETLMTVLILLLVSSVVAAGIPAAVSAYTKVIDAANAQTMLSTAVSSLRNELSTAKDVTINADSIKYFSYDTGAYTVISKGGEHGKIDVQDYIMESGGAETTVSHPLVTKTDKDRLLEVTYGSVSANEENHTITITGMEVRKYQTNSEEYTVLAKMPGEDEKLVIHYLG